MNNNSCELYLSIEIPLGADACLFDVDFTNNGNITNDLFSQESFRKTLKSIQNGKDLTASLKYDHYRKSLKIKGPLKCNCNLCIIKSNTLCLIIFNGFDNKNANPIVKCHSSRGDKE